MAGEAVSYQTVNIKNCRRDCQLSDCESHNKILWYCHINNTILILFRCFNKTLIAFRILILHRLP